MRWGAPYKGSKNQIAEWVIKQFPKRKNFYDLFAGGCAVTHCAAAWHKFDNFTSGLTYENVKVGLSPTEGSGLVTLDSDKNGVFKITNKDVQKFVIFQEKTGKGRLMEFYDLSGLTLD